MCRLACRIGSRVRSNRACRLGSTWLIDRVSLSAEIRIRAGDDLCLMNRRGRKKGELGLARVLDKELVEPRKIEPDQGVPASEHDRLVTSLDQIAPRSTNR